MKKKIKITQNGVSIIVDSVSKAQRLHKLSSQEVQRIYHSLNPKKHRSGKSKPITIGELTFERVMVEEVIERVKINKVVHYD